MLSKAPDELPRSLDPDHPALQLVVPDIEGHQGSGPLADGGYQDGEILLIGLSLKLLCRFG